MKIKKNHISFYTFILASFIFKYSYIFQLTINPNNIELQKRKNKIFCCLKNSRRFLQIISGRLFNIHTASSHKVGLDVECRRSNNRLECNGRLYSKSQVECLRWFWPELVLMHLKQGASSHSNTDWYCPLLKYKANVKTLNFNFSLLKIDQTRIFFQEKKTCTQNFNTVK